MKYVIEFVSKAAIVIAAVSILERSYGLDLNITRGLFVLIAILVIKYIFVFSSKRLKDKK